MALLRPRGEDEQRLGWPRTKNGHKVCIKSNETVSLFEVLSGAPGRLGPKGEPGIFTFVSSPEDVLFSSPLEREESLPEVRE